MALTHLKKERQALTASNSGFKVVTIGTLQKGEKLERGARDLGYFTFKPEYGDVETKEALAKAFKAKYGPSPKVIEPVYMAESNWYDVNPDKQVCARAFHTTRTGSHIVAEGNGEFVTAYRSTKGGSLIIPTESIPQGETWPYIVKYTDKSGKNIEKLSECPFKNTLQVTFVLEGLRDFLPEKIAARLPYRLAVNFYSTAKNEVEPLYFALNNLRDIFVDKQYPGRSVPCSVTPLAIYRHQVEDKRIIENGQEQRIVIYPTRLEMSSTLAEAFSSAQLANQNAYLQYVSAGYLPTGEIESTELPLAIAAPKLPDIKGDVNDLLFGEEPVTTKVSSRVLKPSAPDKIVTPVVDDVMDGDFTETRDIVRAAQQVFNQLGMKVPTNLNNIKEVMGTLWDYNVGVGSAVATAEGTVNSRKKAMKEMIESLMGEEIITNYWFENLCIYFFRTSEMCEKEFSVKEDMLTAKKWWDDEKNKIPF